MIIQSIAYLTLVFGIPAMFLVAEQFDSLSGPDSGWLATGIPIANLTLFVVLVLYSRSRKKWLHLLGGVAGTMVLYFVWGILYMLMNPDTAFDGIQ